MKKGNHRFHVLTLRTRTRQNVGPKGYDHARDTLAFTQVPLGVSFFGGGRRCPFRAIDGVSLVDEKKPPGKPGPSIFPPKRPLLEALLGLRLNSLGPPRLRQSGRSFRLFGGDKAGSVRCDGLNLVHNRPCRKNPNNWNTSCGITRNTSRFT